MNKKNLEILGLGEGATKQDVKSAYETLRAKYLEERFMDGEVGNNAAKMLSVIEQAYNDLMNELSENAAAEDSESSFLKVEELIKSGDIHEAQRGLDSFKERGGRWECFLNVFLALSSKRCVLPQELDKRKQETA